MPKHIRPRTSNKDVPIPQRIQWTIDGLVINPRVGADGVRKLEPIRISVGTSDGGWPGKALTFQAIKEARQRYDGVEITEEDCFLFTPRLINPALLTLPRYSDWFDVPQVPDVNENENEKDTPIDVES